MSARPFTEQEYTTLLAYFTAKKMPRNRVLLVASCGRGYPITEWLSVTVGQVWSGTEVLRELTIARRNLKGGHGAYKRSVKSRRVPLPETVRTAIADHLKPSGWTTPLAHSFPQPERTPAGWNGPKLFVCSQPLVRPAELIPLGRQLTPSARPLPAGFMRPLGRT